MKNQSQNNPPQTLEDLQNLKPKSASWARLTSITIKFYYTFVAAPFDEREIMLEEFNNAAATLKTPSVKEAWNDLYAAFIAKHIELKEGGK